jgi:hypothetical protein
MLIREFTRPEFLEWECHIRVRMPKYSHAIKIRMSARTKQEATNLIRAQYGKDTQILYVRRAL